MEPLEQGEQKKQLPYFGIGLAFLFAAATFFSGLEVGSRMNQEANIASLFGTEDVSARADLKEFWAVWNLLDKKFVSSATSTPLTDEQKVEGAIAGLVAAFGDPYTTYFPPVEAKMFEADISGNFGGVGMEVGMRENMVTVIAPLPESPAAAAGVQAGDVVVKIDGESTEGMSVDEAVKKIRGEKGTKVNLTLARKDANDFIEVSITRDTINIPTVKTEERGDVFVIALYNFSAISEAKTQEALRAFMKSGKTKLVFDLRGNPGGYLESAVNIASYFLPVGKVIVRENFGDGQEEQVYRSLGRDLHAYRDFKTVVLVDGGSASAAEILAGALKEQGVATVIGTQTFGKGSVQELVPLEKGSSLKVTIARWLTPDGNWISKKGVTPDVVVEYTAKDREEQKDPQMDAAIEYLRKN